MKIIISERQQRLIKESSMRDKLLSQIKEEGWKSTSEMVGGNEVLKKVLKIDSPMDFLHLFDDMEVVQSEEKTNWTLFRYKPKKNLMVYDRKNEKVYINYNEIWSVLEEQFRFTYSEIQELTQRWLDEVYNLRGVTTKTFFGERTFTLDEVYNLRGVTTVVPSGKVLVKLDEVYNLRGVTTKITEIKPFYSWMRSTI